MPIYNDCKNRGNPIRFFKLTSIKASEKANDNRRLMRFCDKF
jgi:hypothetical protein